MSPKNQERQDRIRAQATLSAHLRLSTKLEQILPPGQMGFEEMGKLMDGGSWVFRALPANDCLEFKRLARQNYTPFSNIEGIWHPIYQAECVKINHEHSLYRIDSEDSVRQAVTPEAEKIEGQNI